MPGRRRLPRSGPEAQGVDPRALHRLVRALADDHPELHSVMVVRHGHVVAEGWAHPFGPERPHATFSVGKSLTATAVAIAAGEGLLDVDDLLLDHVGDAAPRDPSVHLRAMRLRHLLTMTTGHHDDPSERVRSGDDWLGAFLAEPVAHEPGTWWVYNTAATYALSAVVQRVTGQRMLDYLRPRLLDPLGVEGASWEQCPRGADVGGSGLSLTTEDLAVLGECWRLDGLWRGRRLLPAGWVAEATAAHVPGVAPTDADAPTGRAAGHADPHVDASGYGYQLWRLPGGSWCAYGAFGQHVVVVPDRDLVVVTTGGTPDSQGQRDAIRVHLLPGLADGPLAPDPDGTALLRDALSSLVLPPADGLARGAAGDRISGRRVDLDPNPAGIVSFVLDVGDAADRLTVDAGGRGLVLDVGHGEPVAARVRGLWGTEPENVLVSGGWTRPDRYELQLRRVDTAFLVTATLVVTSDDVRVESGVNVAFGPTTFPALRGRVAPVGAVARPAG